MLTFPAVMASSLADIRRMPMQESMNEESPAPALNRAKPPRVVFWFKTYCVVSGLVYALLTCLLFALAQDLNREPHAGLGLSGALGFVATILCLFFVTLLVASVLPLISWPQPWIWIYGSVLLGVTTAFVVPLFPVTLPLLFFWQKAETKRFLLSNLSNSPAGTS
jgi:hypothetical protein